ncbi:lipopolysaccharide assembly protein LapB [Arsukibacterium sp. MJ3]|uniref:tetratricopeptide repeat protein n=1 Tax=Arsukibacterium sp. MJ3 TaxID=1632859 RepID=UPI00069ADDF8|nr:tetratricopeptide repeat protein [Arsukibacterium sp. MJ3]
MPNYKLKLLTTALLSLTLFIGCNTARLPANVLAPLPYSAALATAEAKVPTLEDIFTLSVEQQAEFLAYFTAPERQTIAAHERLYQFLERKISGFDYQGKNHTASQAYALNSGNCMSLAVLTKALADIAGIEVKFQSIVSAPVYSIENDLMLTSDHVRTFLYDPAALSPEGKHYQAQSIIIVDYMPTAGYRMTGPRISNDTFFAMFYRNLAADALLAEQYEQALALMRTALALAPTYGAAINLTAVVHRRLDYPALAQQFYQYGLDVSESKAALISNFAVLKQSIGDKVGADALFEYLATLDEHDPYQWYVLGKTASQQQNYSEALTYFKKATQQAPYIHQLQLELALAYFQNNQLKLAYQTMIKATELAAGNGMQLRYYAKLEAIKLQQ